MASKFTITYQARGSTLCTPARRGDRGLWLPPTSMWDADGGVVEELVLSDLWALCGSAAQGKAPIFSLF
eukprot:5549927-Heterocapsa_arctica.AAC.1